jgi:oxygen-independent coproporphyrinogen III oxidase
MFSPDIFARYAAMRVPRYTSYPTSPNFSEAIDDTQYRRWLRALLSDSEVSVYLHIPFCREMCWYCGCHTSVARRRPPISSYIDALIAEIRLVASELQSRPRIGHLHWGGGSPTLLTPADVEKVTRALNEAFQSDPLAENAVEIDPRTLDEPLSAAFSRGGVNRASLGVQTFDPAVQQAINRVQSFGTVAQAVGMLRSNGVPALNFDLMYGLPFQTVKSCLDTVEQALKLQPDRLAVFGYAHVPSFKPHQRKIDEGTLPTAVERHAQSNAIAAALTAAGYRQIGLDHFALPGDSLAVASEKRMLRRNFQGYTTDSCATLIAFGASAIGRFRQGFVQNSPNIPDYQRRIARGHLAVARGSKVTQEDARRAAIIEQLMCDYRADIGCTQVPLDQLESDGLIHRSGNWIEVSEDGRPFVRAVAAAFEAYLPHAGDYHTRAV